MFPQKMSSSNVLHQQASHLLHQPEKRSPLGLCVVSAADVGDDDTSDGESDSEPDIISRRSQTPLLTSSSIPIDPAREDTRDSPKDMSGWRGTAIETTTSANRYDEPVEGYRGTTKLRARPSAPRSKGTPANPTRLGRPRYHSLSDEVRDHNAMLAHINKISALKGETIPNLSLIHI